MSLHGNNLSVAVQFDGSFGDLDFQIVSLYPQVEGRTGHAQFRLLRINEKRTLRILHHLEISLPFQVDQAIGFVVVGGVGQFASLLQQHFRSVRQGNGHRLARIVHQGGSAFSQ